jgi:hypothetical protein
VKAAKKEIRKMLFDPMRKLTNMDGTDAIDADGKVLTLGVMSCRALVGPDQGASLDDQVKRYSLARRIYDATLPIEITVEEGALLKKLIAKLGSPLITGQVVHAIENPPPGQAANLSVVS